MYKSYGCWCRNDLNRSHTIFLQVKYLGYLCKNWFVRDDALKWLPLLWSIIVVKCKSRPTKQNKHILYTSHVFLVWIHVFFQQIYHKGIWGSICPDGWTLYEASAVCRHLALGFAEQAIQTDYFGRSRIVLSGVQCEGNETNLFMCKHREFGDVECPGEIGKMFFKVFSKLTLKSYAFFTHCLTMQISWVPWKSTKTKKHLDPVQLI